MSNEQHIGARGYDADVKINFAELPFNKKKMIVFHSSS